MYSPGIKTSNYPSYGALTLVERETKMFIIICVVLSIFGVSQAQVFGFGKCAKVQTQETLDLNKVNVFLFDVSSQTNKNCLARFNSIYESLLICTFILIFSILELGTKYTNSKPILKETRNVYRRIIS